MLVFSKHIVAIPKKQKGIKSIIIKNHHHRLHKYHRNYRIQYYRHQ